MLLARPDFDATKHREIICDADGYVANAWRAIQFAPAETAKYCDWPCNHADLQARRKKIISEEEKLLSKLVSDDEYHDAKIAGYWIWCMSMWIGHGLTRPTAVPCLTADQGVGQMPRLTADQGVGKATGIYAWFENLSQRLRHVKVVCGDWSRVCGGHWQDAHGICGIYFDPPYSSKNRGDIYAKDSQSISHDVREWCIKRDSKNMRIVLSGYEGEHNELEAMGWKKIEWKAAGGYGNRSLGKNENCNLERLWCSPNCLDQDANNLFATEEDA